MSIYFKESETACKCGCGMNVEQSLLNKLDEARLLADTPFVITSGARCLSHNRKIGSKDTSSHVKGLAVDIRAANSQERYAVLLGLFYAGFKRIGINTEKGFIHADIDEDKAQNLVFKY